MEIRTTRQGRQQRAVLCGIGEGTQTIAETLREGGVAVEHYTSLQEAAEAACNLAPSVLIVEQERIASPEASKVRLRLNLTPDIRILAIGAEASYADPAELVRTGVAGFIEAALPFTVLEKAFECIARGELWVTRRLLAEMVSNQPSGSTSLLTRRELEILKRMASGDNNRQIADALFVTRDTVRWHLRSAYAKLGVHDRHAASELLWLGAENGQGSYGRAAAKQLA
jgi:DNA-binding NarL/FixJ family response regulator